MARLKLSEYRAKTVVNELLGITYVGWSVTSEMTPPVSYGDTNQFVVKVDQAVKQRFKKGLIFLDVAKTEIMQKINILEKLGYTSMLIEPYIEHGDDQERYLSFRRERHGVVFSYSASGGIEIETHAESIETNVFENFDLLTLSRDTNLSVQQLTQMRAAFDTHHMTLLEINPYVVNTRGVTILDVAIEVDSSAELLVGGWSELDVRNPTVTRTAEEDDITQLKKESSASFSLEVINPDGSIFLLLSGGGASVVIADEIYTLGLGDQLANYGEYSGNPTQDETYRYTTQVIKLLLKSKSKKKVVLVGGAVANFTDISATFEGIIAALHDRGGELAKQKVKFYVRRGGPRQAQGLKKIEKALSNLGILGGVYDPKTSIPEAVQSMVEGLK